MRKIFLCKLIFSEKRLQLSDVKVSPSLSCLLRYKGSNLRNTKAHLKNNGNFFAVWSLRKIKTKSNQRTLNCNFMLWTPSNVCSWNYKLKLKQTKYKQVYRFAVKVLVSQLLFFPLSFRTLNLFVRHFTESNESYAMMSLNTCKACRQLRDASQHRLVRGACSLAMQ